MKIGDDGHLTLHCLNIQGWPSNRELPSAGTTEVSSAIFTSDSRIAAAYARACGHKVMFAAPGILAEVLDDDPAYRLEKPKDKLEGGKVYTLSVRTTMLEVSWDDVKAGDTVYYLTKQQMRRPASNVEPHGPFIVVDPAKGILRNGQNVELPFRNTQLTLLIITNTGDSS